MSTDDIMSEHQILTAGLFWSGFDAARQQRVGQETKDTRFRSYFGSGPEVVAKIFEDLVEYNTIKIKLSDIFLAMHLLKCYPMEAILFGTFMICKKSAQTAGWKTIEQN